MADTERPDWTEAGTDADRFRYRERDGWTNPERRYELEYWHGSRREWREVRNINSQAWFAMGVEVGRTMREQREMAL